MSRPWNEPSLVKNACTRMPLFLQIFSNLCDFFFLLTKDSKFCDFSSCWQKIHSFVTFLSVEKGLKIVTFLFVDNEFKVLWLLFSLLFSLLKGFGTFLLIDSKFCDFFLLIKPWKFCEFSSGGKRTGNSNTRSQNIQSGHRDGIWLGEMRHDSNEKRKATPDGRNGTTKSRQN